jgi:prepilin-type N-terminal cleavage/methylation domain-containing protein
MNRDGFTLIEVIVALLIFAVAILALTSSTGFVGLQMQAADLRTERSVARQQALEQLRAQDFDGILSAAKSMGHATNGYQVWWDVVDLQWALKEVRIYTEGPGFRDGRRQDVIEDTLVVRLARPVL